MDGGWGGEGTLILPGTGRGTMRSMVEGAILLAQHRGASPLHHAASRRGPPPRVGEELMSAMTQNASCFIALTGPQH
jgi:hypothetical protein